MMFARRAYLVVFALIFWTGQAFAGLTREALNRQYRGLKGFTGSAVQTRSSPYLLKPLRSEVQIAYENEILSWQVQGQDKFEVKFPAKGQPELVSGDGVKGGSDTHNSVASNMPAAARRKLLETLKALRSLMLLDPKLDDDFLVTVKGQELWIIPRPNQSNIFFEEIVLLFDPAMQLQSMRLKTQDDVTQLTFLQLKWIK